MMAARAPARLAVNGERTVRRSQAGRPGSATHARVARPRDAGTLVLLRRSGRGTEALLGRRGEGTRFMPGFFVFPGGVVDPGDVRVRAASPLDPAIVDLARVAGRPARAHAIAVAAVRETFEETGLLLAAPGDVGNATGPDWGEVRARGLAPDLGRLRFVGRAITPTRLAIRYHARFFVADATGCEGELAGNGELADLAWYRREDLEGLQLAVVTRFMLERAIEVAEAYEGPRTSVLFSQRRGRRTVTVYEPPA